MVFMIVLLVLVVWVLYWLWKNNKLAVPSQKENPADILKTRYAKGEITKKQFEEMKKELEG